ncbi:MAG: hypothetical protein KC492_07805, partial [Myxococcales bacterium]|nr:hypothetical protein [Myxococcales bacterium]
MSAVGCPGKRARFGYLLENAVHFGQQTFAVDPTDHLRLHPLIAEADVGAAGVLVLAGEVVEGAGGGRATGRVEAGRVDGEAGGEEREEAGAPEVLRAELVDQAHLGGG